VHRKRNPSGKTAKPAAFLADIRNRTKLRKLGEAKQRRTNTRKPAKKKPLSMAEEMRAKLNRRRKALSGKQDEDEQNKEKNNRKARAAQIARPPRPASGKLNMDGMNSLSSLLAHKGEEDARGRSETGATEEDDGDDWD
jgi:hypothetical protein